MGSRVTETGHTHTHAPALLQRRTAGCGGPGVCRPGLTQFRCSDFWPGCSPSVPSRLLRKVTAVIAPTPCATRSQLADTQRLAGFRPWASPPPARVASARRGALPGERPGRRGQRPAGAWGPWPPACPAPARRPRPPSGPAARGLPGRGEPAAARRAGA